LVDLAPLDGSDPADNWSLIRKELLEFSVELAEKPELVVLNKVDLLEPEERDARIERFAGAIGMPKGERPIAISGATGEGVRALLEGAWKLAGKTSEPIGGMADSARRPGAGGWGQTPG
jgi:GTP-binding protein